jgi:tetratricopeptide (TPR) repeat protein
MFSCKKEWLDAKPQQSLVVPNSIADYQSLLDNVTGANNGAAINSSANIIDELGAGDMYITDATYNARSFIERNTYIWAGDIYGSEANYSPWASPYKRVFNTNVILEGIEKIAPQSSQEVEEWNQVKGSALFLRGYSHYDIARLFCKPYDKATSSSDLGIPLRTNSDFNEPSKRATVQTTYDQILSDLKKALALLPISVPNSTLYKLRPTKTAADAMLARVYLSMGEYDSTFLYANEALTLDSTLIDYNSIPITSSSTAFQRFNNEVIFHLEGGTWFSLLGSALIVDSTLYKTYDNSDLRRSILYNTNASGISRFKGSYSGSSTVLFAGLATDEMYLIRAESYARKGMITEAMNDLNRLMLKRWKKAAPFLTIVATDQNDALRKILIERRKELCLRGLRWSDLRRLNKESSFATTLTKKVNGQIYSLPSNDPKYVFPIPPSVIQVTGMEQNQRD